MKATGRAQQRLEAFGGLGPGFPSTSSTACPPSAATSVLPPAAAASSWSEALEGVGWQPAGTEICFAALLQVR